MRRDDAAIVRAVREGRTELFADLVDRHAGAVFRVVRSAVRHGPDAEDIAQESFLASFRALPRMRDPRSFRAHLLAIAARKVADHLRRKRSRPREVALEAEPAARESGAGGGALLAAVQAEVDRLSPDARLLVALRHHEGLSCVQIARLLDLPEGTVYSRISRLHAALRRALEVNEG